MRIDDNDVPHIQAQCSSCGFLYDLKFGISCPACNGIGVRWARLVTAQEAQEYGSEARTRLRNALDSLASPVDLDPDTTQEVVWCERLYDLEDTRR
jgi:hypothetical protein